MAEAKGDHMDRSLQEIEDGREGKKEGEEEDPVAGGRGSPAGAGEVKCDLMVGGGSIHSWIFIVPLPHYLTPSKRAARGRG